MKLLLVVLCLIPIILSSLTFEFEKIGEFAESGDYGQFHRLLVDDSYLYAISIYGFEINEVNEFSGELTRISLIPFEGEVDGIEKIGANVFVSVSTRTSYQTEILSSLYKIDVSDPFEPVIVDSIIFPDNIRNYILRKSGEYISYHKLEEINNTWFFTELVFMDPITFENVTSYEIHTFTDHLKENYFLQQRNPGEYDFDVYDYSDINNIQLVSSVDFSSCPTAFLWGHAIDDSTFVLLGNNSISFYDFSDIYNIEYISTHDRYVSNSSPFGDCIRIDDYVLIPSQRAGIEVVDISDIENPIIFDFWEYPYEEISSISPFFLTTGGLSFNNGHLYVGTFYDGILLMNFTNGSIEYVDKFINNRINSLKHRLHDNKLFSTGYSGGIYVQDIEDITSPTIETIIFEDLFVDTFEIVNNYIFISTTLLSTMEHFLKVYDISDLSNPVLHLDQLMIGTSIFLINENEPDYLYRCSLSLEQPIEIGKYLIQNPYGIELVLLYPFQEITVPSFFYEGYLYMEEWDDDGVKDLLIYDGFEDENPELVIDLPNFIGNAKLYKTENYLQISRHSNPDSDDFYNLINPLSPELAFTTPISSKWRGSKIRDNVLFSPSKFTVYLYDIEDNPSGELEPFNYFNLNSRYKDMTFYSQGEDDYFFCEQLECISTYNYSIETSADEKIPNTEITLSNYPNPFNPETNIVFNLMEECDVQLDIYNIKGQKIRSLINEQIEAGEHSVVWDGDNSLGKKVSSGLYLYKLKINNKTELVKKCMLLK